MLLPDFAPSKQQAGPLLPYSSLRPAGLNRDPTGAELVLLAFGP